MPDLGSFGRYRLTALLGRGGTTSAYRATDGSSELVLKILHDQLSGDALLRERFRRELLAARVFSHPGVARVHDLVEDGGRLALAMELLPGGNLASRGKAGPAEVESWLRALAPALQAAHDAGLVHRGLKPENILFDAEGRPRLADFGQAALRELAALSSTSSFLASPAYEAPEAASGAPPEPRWDLYSLGAVLRRALLGETREASGGAAGALYPRPLARRPLAELLPDCPPRLALLLDAMVGPPEGRPRRAGDLAAWLEGSLGPRPASGKRCLFCGRPMEPGFPSCLSCGEEDVLVDEPPPPDAEYLFLTKATEDAEALAGLYDFLEAWSSEPRRSLRLITEDARMYSKEEREGAVAVPHPLLRGLSAADGRRVAEALGRRGAKRLGVTRYALDKGDRRAKAKEPLLQPLRPWPRPEASDFFERHAGGRSAGAAPASGRFAGREGPGAAADRGAPGGPAARLALPEPARLGAGTMERILALGLAVSAALGEFDDGSLDRAVDAAAAAARTLDAAEAELAALMPGTLYVEALRIEALLEESGTAPGRAHEELLERRRVNREAARRHEELGREYGRLANRLLGLESALSGILARLEGGGGPAEAAVDLGRLTR